MNSRFCGAGLNLQACTNMIIYHKMNESLITQIIGRAQRYGRTTALNVYSFDD
jgi:SNF2 family DNA or RNA helicase